MKISKIKSFIPIYLMAFVFIMDLLLLQITHKNWQNSMNKYIPLKSEIQDIKTEISLGHLWFEESIGGDAYIDIENDVMKKFRHNKYKIYVQKAQKIFIEDDEKIFANKLFKIERNLTIFLKLAKIRLENIKEHRIGSLLDQKFDKKFKEILIGMTNLDRLIDMKIATEFKQKENTFIVIISLFLLVNFLIFRYLLKLKKTNQESNKQLQEEKEKAVVTLHSIGDAVITTDEQGFITYLNPIAEKLTAYKNSEAIGKYHDEVFYIINEHTKQRVASPVNEVLKKGKIIELSNHVALVNKNMKHHFIEDSAAPIKDKEGKILGTVLVFHDVTKQKKDREKLSENEKLLVQQSKMAAMGEMLENIAHQWRQPLSAISSLATGLKLRKEMDSLDDNFLLNSLDTINDSTQYLSKTIDDFRNFFSTSKTKETFQIRSLCKKTLTMLSSKLKNRNIKIIDEMEDIKVSTLQNELIQVLMIVLNNAIDILEKKDSKKAILIKIFEKKSKIHIIIHDSGGGVDDSIINRIFEPYFTTKHKKQGTGIGLYMAEEIISKHMNGKIKIKNSSFKQDNVKYFGAQFIIELPKEI